MPHEDMSALVTEYEQMESTPDAFVSVQITMTAVTYTLMSLKMTQRQRDQFLPGESRGGDRILEMVGMVPSDQTVLIAEVEEHINRLQQVAVRMLTDLLRDASRMTLIR